MPVSDVDGTLGQGKHFEEGLEIRRRVDEPSARATHDTQLNLAYGYIHQSPRDGAYLVLMPSRMGANDLKRFSVGGHAHCN